MSNNLTGRVSGKFTLWFVDVMFNSTSWSIKFKHWSLSKIVNCCFCNFYLLFSTLSKIQILGMIQNLLITLIVNYFFLQIPHKIIEINFKWWINKPEFWYYKTKEYGKVTENKIVVINLTLKDWWTSQYKYGTCEICMWHGQICAVEQLWSTRMGTCGTRWWLELLLVIPYQIILFRLKLIRSL